VTCVPDRVTGYVDDALDAATRAEVESHLATCAACREQIAFERDLRAGLRALPAPEPRPGFEAALRRRLAAERRGGRPWLLPFAAALALLALWARGTAPFVAWEVARDHNHCFGKERLPAKLWSNDPVEVSRWFEAQGTRLPPIPAGVGELGLVGARYCPLLDRVAAHLYYAGEERTLSLFVLSGPARFRDSWATESRGNEVRFLRSAGMTVALVSAKPEDVEAFRAAFATTMARLEASTNRAASIGPSDGGPAFVRY
jgi:anti-sigma factor RsiW